MSSARELGLGRLNLAAPDALLHVLDQVDGGLLDPLEALPCQPQALASLRFDSGSHTLHLGADGGRLPPAFPAGFPGGRGGLSTSGRPRSGCTTRPRATGGPAGDALPRRDPSWQPSSDRSSSWWPCAPLGGWWGRTPISAIRSLAPALHHVVRTLSPAVARVTLATGRPSRTHLRGASSAPGAPARRPSAGRPATSRSASTGPCRASSSARRRTPAAGA